MKFDGQSARDAAGVFKRVEGVRGEIDGNQHTMPDFGEALVRFGENPVLPGFTDRKDRTIGLRDDPLGGRTDAYASDRFGRAFP